MRSNSFSDTNLLLSTVTGLCLVLLLKLPQFLDYVGRGLAELWRLMRHIW
jgi:hypothetical protein